MPKTVYDLETWIKNQNIDLKICCDKGKFRARANNVFDGESKTLSQALENCMFAMRLSAQGTVAPAQEKNSITCPQCGSNPSQGAFDTFECPTHGLFTVRLHNGIRVHVTSLGNTCEWDGIRWVVVP